MERLEAEFASAKDHIVLHSEGSDQVDAKNSESKAVMAAYDELLKHFRADHKREPSVNQKKELMVSARNILKNRKPLTSSDDNRTRAYQYFKKVMRENKNV